MRTLRRWLSVTILLYGVFLSVSVVVPLFLPDTGPLMALYITGAHLLLLSAVLLLPIALLFAKPRLAALALLPPALVFLFHYGSQFIPERADTTRSGTQAVRIMTYNIQWRQSDYQASIDVIRAGNADIVALQEVSLEAGAILDEALADVYPHRALVPNVNGYAGAAVLSRYPILEARYFPAAFGNQRLLVDVDGVPLVVYNIHTATPLGTGGFLQLDPAQRSLEVRQLVDMVREDEGRVVVAGDFNLTDLSNDYTLLSAVFEDTYRAVGWGMGWTHPGPFIISRELINLHVLRIDYIFIRGSGLRALDSVVWLESGGSDHLAVISRVEVFDPSGSYAG